MSNVQMSILIDNNSLFSKYYFEFFGVCQKLIIKKPLRMTRENENLLRKGYAPGIQVGNNS